METNPTLSACSIYNVVKGLLCICCEFPTQVQVHLFMSAVFVFMGTHSSRPTPFIKGQMKQNKALQEDKEGEDLDLMRVAGGERCIFHKMGGRPSSIQAWPSHM